MKLTPLDIQQQRFPRGLSGYDKKEVHAFLEFVSREVESLLGELGHLRERIGKQDDELFRFREREETLKEALVTAQKMAEDMRGQAKKESDLIIAEAEMKAERIIHSAHGRLLQILEEISDLKRQRVQLVSAIRHVLDNHGKLLDTEPAEKSGEDESVTYLRTKGPRPAVPEAPLPPATLSSDTPPKLKGKA
ncbi:MAG: DivIVA domain-containing protein [Deltaproteobacteria bacterium]|nr:DivIVA domain-containing protein [Deltaproteobacteria bacterium]